MKTILSLLLWTLSSALLIAQIPFTAKEGVLAYKNSLSPHLQTQFRFHNGFTTSLDPATGKATRWDYCVLLPFADAENRGDSVIRVQARREQSGWRFVASFWDYAPYFQRPRSGDSALAWMDSDAFVMSRANNSAYPELNTTTVGNLLHHQLSLLASNGGKVTWEFPVEPNKVYALTTDEKEVTHTRRTDLLLNPTAITILPQPVRDILSLEKKYDLAQCGISPFAIMTWDVSLQAAMDTFKSLSIYTVRGALAFFTTQEQREYDVGTLANGFYLLRYEAGTTVQWLPFVIGR